MSSIAKIQDIRGQSQDIYQKIFCEVADGIVGIDSRGTIRLCNPAAEAIFGWQPGQLLGRSLDVLLPDKVQAYHDGLIADFQSGPNDTRNMGQRNSETVGKRADGTQISLGITILRTQADVGPMMIAVIRDVSEVLFYQHELQRLADTDPLTALLNRRAFRDKAVREIEQSLSRNSSVSTILFDLDNFKSVNDTYGHDAGDDVIHNFAETVKDTVSKHVLVGRWGGEEFITLLPNTSLDHAGMVAEAVRRNVEVKGLMKYASNPPKITVSAGVADMAQNGESLSVLISRADTALYDAKKLGRNRVAFWSDSENLKASA